MINCSKKINYKSLQPISSRNEAVLTVNVKSKKATWTLPARSRSR